MNDEFYIYQGDTGPVVYYRPSVLPEGEAISGNWSCWISVIDIAGNTVIDPREVTDLTPGNLEWVTALTPAETATLPTDWSETSRPYRQVVEVRNPDTIPPFNRETHTVINVCAQGLQNA